MRGAYGRRCAEFNRAQRASEKRKQERRSVCGLMLDGMGSLLAPVMTTMLLFTLGIALLMAALPFILLGGLLCIGVVLLTGGMSVSEAIKEHAKHNVIIK